MKLGFIGLGIMGTPMAINRDWILRERNGESADRCIAEK